MKNISTYSEYNNVNNNIDGLTYSSRFPCPNFWFDVPVSFLTDIPVWWYVIIKPGIMPSMSRHSVILRAKRLVCDCFAVVQWFAFIYWNYYHTRVNLRISMSTLSSMQLIRLIFRAILYERVQKQSIKSEKTVANDVS